VNLLQDKTVLDFSYRLPGPLATKQLLDLGAKVIKIENTNYPDPFSQIEMDASFKSWYLGMNQDKEVKGFDFNSSKDQKEILKLVNTSDIILLGLPKKQQELLGITKNLLKSKPQIFIEPISPPKHDLNILAENGTLALYLKDKTEDFIAPPFLPIAGIFFAQKLANTSLAGLLRANEQKQALWQQVSFEASMKELLAPLTAKELNTHWKYLHNGAYPCYGIYKTKDGGHIAVAAVEEKFWQGFSELFEINLNLEQRFDISGETVKKLISTFKKYTVSELEVKIQGHNLCLSPVRLK